MVREYGGTHNNYSGPESDGRDVNYSYGSPVVWWLRSPGTYTNVNASVVYPDGYVNYYSYGVSVYGNSYGQHVIFYLMASLSESLL